jgi:oligoribonuclease (3'-5' exoribonuclease)
MSDYYVFTDFETNGFYTNEDDVPIEVGMAITDDEYNILDTLTFYLNTVDTDQVDWEGEEREAFKVHGITIDTLRREGKEPVTAVALINQFLNKQASINGRTTRFIIVSDNAQMEYNAMWKLYKMSNTRHLFPFHYSAWDINILINSIQKVEKGKILHRALPDVFRMYKAKIRALERNGFRKWPK